MADGVTGIISFVFIGLISGWLASQIVEGRGLGTFADVVVGIIGAVVGGFIFNILGMAIPYGFWGSIGTSVLGAVVVLFLAEALMGTRRVTKI